MLGLANLLRRYGITYEQFGVALDQVNGGDVVQTPAFALASQFKAGITEAAAIARSHKMVRAFAIAPTASCSYRSKDLDGFTATPEIAPPISRTVDRDSGTFGVQTYDYGDVEIASEVGWDAYKRVADGLMEMLSPLKYQKSPEKYSSQMYGMKRTTTWHLVTLPMLSALIKKLRRKRSSYGMRGLRIQITRSSKQWLPSVQFSLYYSHFLELMVTLVCAEQVSISAETNKSMWQRTASYAKKWGLGHHRRWTN
jgi:hypothetical protein